MLVVVYIFVGTCVSGFLLFQSGRLFERWQHDRMHQPSVQRSAKCPVDGCQIRGEHSHVDAFLDRLKEK